MVKLKAFNIIIEENIKTC